MCSGRGCQTLLWCFKVPLFGDPRIEACLPAPQGFSQVTTSFIGSWCQGIHRLHLVACFSTKMLASTVKFSRCGRIQDIGSTRRRRCASRRRIVALRNRPLRTQQRAQGCHPLPHVPLPHGLYLFAWCDSLIVNVPHSVASLPDDERIGNKQMDRAGSANGSLERR